MAIILLVGIYLIISIGVLALGAVLTLGIIKMFEFIDSNEYDYRK